LIIQSCRIFEYKRKFKPSTVTKKSKRNKSLKQKFNYNGASLLFIQAGPSWVQQLIALIKPGNASAPFFSKSCEVLSSIIRHAPDFPDVSRQITAAASNLVTSLIDCAKANPNASGPILACIRNLQTYYFGAVGPAIKHLEKFVFENLVNIIKQIKITKKIFSV